MQQDDTQMDLVGRVIGAAIEVHSILGAGFQEITYERALGIELRRRGIAFRRQVQVELTYKGESLGDGAVDMLVEEELVVELKAITSLTESHTRQVLTYLHATGLHLGILLNFHEARLVDGVKRISR